MTRRTTETFHGFNQPPIIVTFTEDDGTQREHRGILRAWAVDDEDGEWWGLCEYYVSAGEQMLGWLPATQIRRELEDADDDGLAASPAP